MGNAEYSSGLADAPRPRRRGDRMRRREFLAIVSGGVAAWSRCALAQQSGRTWRIGFIAHRHERFYDSLFDGLRDLGYTEGQNLIVERRYAEGSVERFRDFAGE